MPSPTSHPSPDAPSRVPTVLVTGAAKRLGRDIALLLAAHGWRVGVHYRDSVEDARQTVAQCAAHTPGAHAFRCNLGNEAAVRNLLPSVIAEFGHVDAVVNNASTFEHDSAADFSFAAMEKHMRSNAGAAILLSQALHTHIVQGKAAGLARSGTVVSLLDQHHWNQTPDRVIYTLSKAALDAANTMLAVALGPLVRVVGVAPQMAVRGPLLKGEKLATNRLEKDSSRTASAVLLALQDTTLSGTTLLVEEEQVSPTPAPAAAPLHGTSPKTPAAQGHHV